MNIKGLIKFFNNSVQFDGLSRIEDDMTKKDYELIAGVLASENRFTFRRSIEASNAGDKTVEQAQANRQYEVGQIAKILARKFKQDNPRFDEQMWFASVNED